MRRFLFFLGMLLVLCLRSPAANPPAIRTWTSAKGTQIKAQFIRHNASMVVLRTESGKQTMIRLSDISQADRDYVAGLDQARKTALAKKKEAVKSRLNRSSGKKAQTRGINAEYLSKQEREVIDEMNLARTDPQGYAEHLRVYRKTHIGNGFFETKRGRMRTQEGLNAVDEAIAFLEKAKAVSPLGPSKGLSLAAKSHVDDIGPAGITGHTGTKGSTMTDRINAQGKWQKTIGENIAFGRGDARETVMQLIVDDGVPSRGHRTNIYKAEFKVAGVAVGPHKQYGFMCVIDYAGGFSD